MTTSALLVSLAGEPAAARLVVLAASVGEVGKLAEILAQTRLYLVRPAVEKSPPGLLLCQELLDNTQKNLSAASKAAPVGNTIIADWAELSTLVSDEISRLTMEVFAASANITDTYNDLAKDLIRQALDIRTTMRTFFTRGIHAGRNKDQVIADLYTCVSAFGIAGGSTKRLMECKNTHLKDVITWYKIVREPKGSQDISFGRLAIAKLDFYGCLVNTGKARIVGNLRPKGWPAMYCSLLSAGMIPQGKKAIYDAYLEWLKYSGKLFPTNDEAKSTGSANIAWTSAVLDEKTRNQLLCLAYNSMPPEEQILFASWFGKFTDAELKEATKSDPYMTAMGIAVSASVPGNSGVNFMESGKVNPNLTTMYKPSVLAKSAKDWEALLSSSGLGLLLEGMAKNKK